MALPYVMFILSIILLNVSLDVTALDIHATDWPVDTNVIHGDSVTFLVTVIEPVIHDTPQRILEWFIEWEYTPYNLIIRSITAKTTTLQPISDIARPEFAGRGMYNTEYSVVNNTSTNSLTHTCKLTITSMTLTDNGYFGLTHQIRADDRHRTLLKDKIRLTVVPVPTSDPQCTHNIHRSPAKDILTCLSTGDNPPALLTWYERQRPVPPRGGLIRLNTIEIDSNPDLQRVFVCRAVQTIAGLPDIIKTCQIVLNPGAPTLAAYPTTNQLTTDADLSSRMTTSAPATTVTDQPTTDADLSSRMTTSAPATTVTDQPTTLDDSRMTTTKLSQTTSATTSGNMVDIERPMMNTSVIIGAVLGPILGLLLLVIIVLQVKQLRLSRDRQDEQQGGAGGAVEMTTNQDTQEAVYYTEVLDNPRKATPELGAVGGTSGKGTGDDYTDLIRDNNEPETAYMDLNQGDNHAYASSIPYIP